MQLPEPLQELITGLIGAPCFKTLVTDLNVADPVCAKLLISKVLGVGIVAGGSLVKAPQIAKIVKARSGQGISLSSYILETAAYSITLAYNYRHGHPFSTYGETCFVTAQNFIIIALMLRYAHRHVANATVLAVLGAMNAALHNPAWVSMQHLGWLQAATIPVTILSKIPQLIANYRQGHTGQLSAFTVFLYFAGSLARIFTTYMPRQDDGC
jgi:mannose-P-dolichol utilization defect protein 1